MKDGHRLEITTLSAAIRYDPAPAPRKCRESPTHRGPISRAATSRSMPWTVEAPGRFLFVDPFDPLAATSRWWPCCALLLSARGVAVSTTRSGCSGQRGSSRSSAVTPAPEACGMRCARYTTSGLKIVRGERVRTSSSRSSRRSHPSEGLDLAVENRARRGVPPTAPRAAARAGPDPSAQGCLPSFARSDGKSDGRRHRRRARYRSACSPVLLHESASRRRDGTGLDGVSFHHHEVVGGAHGRAAHARASFPFREDP